MSTSSAPADLGEKQVPQFIDLKAGFGPLLFVYGVLDSGPHHRQHSYHR